MNILHIRLKIHFIFLLLAVLSFQWAAIAQTTSNKGTEFWIAYMSHIDGTSSGMSLYITSDVNTSGTVSVPLAGWSTNYIITANTTTVVTIPPATAYINCSDCIDDKGILVTSVLPVVVYSHIYQTTRSDATLTLPVPTLGKEYYTISHKQHTNGQPGTSSFVVVAVEDNTTVQITPTQNTNGGNLAGVPFTVTLNQGQVYQVRATLDLTGSHIITQGTLGTCKRVAVFSGSSYMRMGCTNASSGDNLYQQLYPANSWGSTFITAPFKTRIGGDYFRVMAGTNNTQVTFNGTLTATLNPGQFWDTISAVPSYFSTSQPVTLAQYQRAQNCDGVTGDPSMTILNPVEQTLDSITVYNSPFSNISGHYINVIMKTSDTSLFTLDGSNIPFTVVPANTVYSYAQQTVAAGNHTMLADSGFNAIAYGFGNVESYGYSAGANVRNLDQYIVLSSNGMGNITSTCLGSTVNFSGIVSYIPVSWLWYFGDGNTSTSPSPSHLYGSAGSYTVSLVTVKPVLNSCNTQDSSTIVINIVAPPTANFTSTSVCPGDTTVFNNTSVSGGSTINFWKWYFGDGDSSSLQTPVHIYPSAGTFPATLIIKTNLGCSDTVTNNVIILPFPVANAGADTSVCIGNSVTLNASGGLTYQWNPVTGLSDSLASNPVASPAADITYTVTVSNASGCFDTNSVVVVVHPLPLANAGSDVAFCFGDSTQLAASGGVSYLWSPADSLSSTSAFNPFSSADTTTTYAVLVTDVIGCQATDTVLVEVHPLPIANAGPDSWVCPGNFLQLSATGGTAYSWSPGAELNDSLISNPIATLSGGTTFFIIVTDTNSCQNADTLEVTYVGVVPVNAGVDTSICIGNSLLLGANPTAPPGSTYLWSPVANLSDSLSPNPIANPALLTTFVVEVTNDTCHGRDTIIVSINQLPTPVVAGLDTTLCLGGFYVIGSTSVADNSYLWTSVPVGFLDSVSQLPVSPNDTTLYIVKQTIDSTGCFDFDTVMVSVNVLPVVNAGTDSTFCIGGNKILGSDSLASILYSWSSSPIGFSSNNAFPNVQPNDTTAYYLIGTNAFTNCFSKDTAEIYVNPLPVINAGTDSIFCIGGIKIIGTDSLSNIVYSWSSSPAGFASNQALPTAQPNDTTVYYLLGTNLLTGCISSDSAKIRVNALPVINAGTDTSFCIGGIKNLGTDSLGNIVYTWTSFPSGFSSNASNPVIVPDSSKVYYLNGSFISTGCFKSDTVSVTVFPLPAISVSPDVSLCVGDNTTLSASGGSSYLWSPSAGLNSDTSASPNANPNESTSYFVTVTDTNNCSKSDSVHITVNLLPIANAGQDQTICGGTETTLSGIGGISYSWSPAAYVSSASAQMVTVYPPSNTDFILEVADTNGCKQQDTVAVFVQALPSISFVADSTDGLAPFTVQFTNNTTGAASYLWSFGDGGTSAAINPSHTYYIEGDYVVSLTAVSTQGCRDTTGFRFIKVDNKTYAVIPNVFTPNGDGVNDKFLVRSVGFAQLSGQIYNRWGVLVSENDFLNNGWDGSTTNGNEVSEGTYFYIIVGTDLEGKPNEFRGFVELLK